ncbi:MAG TPA: serine/threonine-protein kinase, partial [Ktedonobacteraceae bacterium]
MQNALPIGTIIQGRYFVQGLLGSSPSGAVYLAQDQYVKSDPFNLLVLKEVVNPSKHKLHQIVLEAMTLRLLQHPALPRVYQVISGGNQDRVYLLMDYIEGPGLERLRVQQPEQRFSFPQAMTLMAPIVDAVAYLHRQQPPIIHQNIKPANILVPTTSDKTVLVNFGIGKRYNLNATTRTAPGRLMVGYEAPEQDSQAAVNQSDIYALGATFYTLLTGVVPLNASYRTMQMESMGNDPLEPINRVRPTISSYVTESIHCALSLSTENRFASVEQFAEALRADPKWKLFPVAKREFDLALKVASRE